MEQLINEMLSKFGLPDLNFNTSDKTLYEKLAIAASVLYFGGKFVDKMGRASRHYEEQRRRERTVYDRRKGHWVTLKRNPTAKEWVEYDRRYANGESASHIFESMGLR